MKPKSPTMTASGVTENIGADDHESRPNASYSNLLMLAKLLIRISREGESSSPDVLRHDGEAGHDS